jgi:DDE family transposase
VTNLSAGSIRFLQIGFEEPGIDRTPSECAALDVTVVFLSHIESLQDTRQPGKVCYPVDGRLLLCLLAVRAGAETIADIAVLGVKKRDLLRRWVLMERLPTKACPAL